ncbi:MAG TPA: hypothetical protein PKE55_11660 [Kiritimatiellia bacterium]|nr:hypothetical protein [Kiritimatiellia bacterium]
MFALLVAGVSAVTAWADGGRIPIAAHQLPYVITNSGSYVVTDHLVGTSGVSAIVVGADFVTLDLNGYSVTGPIDAITQSPGRHGLTIKNGTLRAPNGGIGLLATGHLTRVTGVRIMDYGTAGVRLGKGALVRDVYIGANALTNLSSVIGVDAREGLLARNVTVTGLRAAGGTSSGVNAGAGSVIRDTRVHGNQVFGSFIGTRGGRGSVLHGVTAGANPAGSISTGLWVDDVGVIAGGQVGPSPASGSSRAVFAGSYSVLADMNLGGTSVGALLVSNSVVVRSSFNHPGGSAITADSGNVIRENTIRGGNITVERANLVAGNMFRDAPVNFFADNYVLDNHFTGVTTPLRAGGGFNRIDRNTSAIGAAMVDAGGERNLVVRNRGPGLTVLNGGNDQVAATLNGSASMTAQQPWANINTAP